MHLLIFTLADAVVGFSGRDPVELKSFQLQANCLGRLLVPIPFNGTCVLRVIMLVYLTGLVVDFPEKCLITENAVLRSRLRQEGLGLLLRPRLIFTLL